MPILHYVVLVGAAALAGAVNAVAGGGTLITFPALLYTGQIAKVANATSTVALLPGQISSLWGYRKEMGNSRTAILYLTIPSFLGGLLGSLLLLRTPPKTFAALVPYLILMATLLFMAQEPLSRWQRNRAEQLKQSGAQAENPLEAEEAGATKEQPLRAWAGLMVYQFAVAVYGGYFGAGIGILMLAALGLMGMTNIHRMNGLKNIFAFCINSIASVTFIIKGLVDWRIAALMACGALVGGYSGAGIARRLGQKNVRKLIICIGFVMALSLLRPH